MQYSEIPQVKWLILQDQLMGEIREMIDFIPEEGVRIWRLGAPESTVIYEYEWIFEEMPTIQDWMYYTCTEDSSLGHVIHLHDQLLKDIEAAVRKMVTRELGRNLTSEEYYYPMLNSADILNDSLRELEDYYRSELFGVSEEVVSHNWLEEGF